MDAEPSLFKIIKVARDEDLEEQIGRGIYFDLVDHDKVRNFRIQKQTPFAAFKEEVAKEFGIPVQFLRFWIWANRQNHTYRPYRPLTPQEETQTVGRLREASNKTYNADLKLFLEVELGPDLNPIAPPDKTKEDILLFFKFYDPEKGELRYVGRFFVKSSSKPIEILGKLNQMAGFAPDEEIELYEEIKFEPCVMCVHLDKGTSFSLSQIENGDIICFQKSPPLDCPYPDVPSFLKYVRNRQMVHFRSLEDGFCLELSKLHTYDDVVERMANQIGLDDPSKIRLTSHNCYSQKPEPQPIKYRGVDHLSDMLVHQTSDILYYEVLDIPLPELQGLKNLKVAFHHAMKDEVVIHNIRLPKQSTVVDVINELKTKVELSHSNAELRLLEVFYHKIYKIFPPNEKIENINDHYWTLRAEEIPEEEKNLCPHDLLIHVYHFNKDSAQSQMQVQNFGEPFFLVIHEGETLGEVKVRIQKKLQVPDEEFAKWKFAFLSLGHPEYLQDSDIVFARFQRRDVYGDWEQYLGLEHSDNAPKRSCAANQMQGTPDTRAVSLTATSMSGKSSSTLLENLKNLLAGFSSTKGTEKSTSSSNMSETSLPPNPPSLQQQREVLKNYLASSLESIEKANAFDEIQRITLLLLQHSTSSLERTILKDLASRLEAFKVIVPTTKLNTENVRAQLTSLSGKKADVGTRLGQAREHCDFLEAKFRKDSEEEMEIEKQIVHLMKQKEGLRISKNSLALELEKFSEQVTKDVEEWKVISEESEEANNKWLQVRETLAQANLSWKLFKQNLEQCEKGA